jgi:hypothetical protein
MPDMGTLNYGLILTDVAALGELARLVAKVLGFFLIGFGALRMIRGAGRGGDSESQIFGGAGLSVLCGGVLLSIDTFIAVAGESIGAGGGMRDVGVAAGQVAAVGPAQFTEAVRLAFGVAWVVGFIGMISGLNGLRVTGQNSQVGFSITKIIGGAAAMNLAALVKALANWGGIFSQLAKIVS